jgi:hypothetical protein
MADFCNKCAREIWGEDFEPEIDVPSMAEQLPAGHYIPVICEGCVMTAVIKNEDGSVRLEFFGMNDEPEYETLDEWEKKEKSLRN